MECICMPDVEPGYDPCEVCGQMKDRICYGCLDSPEPPDEAPASPEREDG